MRAVLDPNVIISALLSPDGSPARALREWQHGGFELVVSPLLLAELERALAYPKLRRRIPPEEAGAVVEWLARAATVVPDPDGPPPLRSPDPGDGYLIALAAAQERSSGLRRRPPPGARRPAPGLLAGRVPRPVAGARRELNLPGASACLVTRGDRPVFREWTLLLFTVILQP
ncbi:MAG: PIN domain-containing protein [Actinobacteria bacterium]|nr:PIN domain-containing protein [Actinomycetota bacterium]